MSRPLPTPNPRVLRESRRLDRQLINCVSNPRTIYNVCRLQSPSTLDEDYLLDWIMTNPPLLAEEAIELIHNRKPVYIVDMISKRPDSFLVYDWVKPQDVIIFWDWCRQWERKAGQREKVPVPGFKKILQIEGRALTSRGYISSPSDTIHTKPLFVA